LRECPEGDQLSVQHPGISLLFAFAFVFLITSVSMTIAFPDVAGEKLWIA
jgi:hypothetical protein